MEISLLNSRILTSIIKHEVFMPRFVYLAEPFAHSGRIREYSPHCDAFSSLKFKHMSNAYMKI